MPIVRNTFVYSMFESRSWTSVTLRSSFIVGVVIALFILRFDAILSFGYVPVHICSRAYTNNHELSKLTKNIASQNQFFSHQNRRRCQPLDLRRYKNKFDDVNTKRIESFVVAKTANIQPLDIVLDPICKRGTILIEAAKYWSPVTYIGMDTSLSYLDHVAMNAKSCQVGPIYLQQSKPWDISKTIQSMTLQSHSSSYPIDVHGMIMVDKIMTCLPFGKTKEFYLKLLQDWLKITKDNGNMVLILDVPSLPILLDTIIATQDEKLDNISYLRTLKIRKPYFQWGKMRVTVIVLEKISYHFDDDYVRRKDIVTQGNQYGLLKWELPFLKDYGTGEAPRKVWAQIRRNTVPCPVSSTKVQ